MERILETYLCLCIHVGAHSKVPFMSYMYARETFISLLSLLIAFILTGVGFELYPEEHSGAIICFVGAGATITLSILFCAKICIHDYLYRD